MFLDDEITGLVIWLIIITMASKSHFKHGSSLVRKIIHLSNDMDQDQEDQRENGNGSVGRATYTVHIPPTPDNQPMEISLERSTSRRVEDQYASSSMFTGGFNQVTRAHLKEKVIESESSHPQMAGTKGSSCAVPGCDVKVMTDERGLDILPCECDYKICRDCYRDVLRVGEGICPGCKEPYKEEQEMQEDPSPTTVVNNQQALPLPPGAGAAGSKMERRLSLMKSGTLGRSQANDFDHAQWLFETKGSYGYGNAMWPKDSENDASSGSGSDWMAGDPNVFHEKPWRPLTRKLSISAAILSPYRYDTLCPLSFCCFSPACRIGFSHCCVNAMFQMIVFNSSWSL